jgi:hypothetical protein
MCPVHKSWGKSDANQPEIVAALRKAGYAVQSLTAVGGGCPDLLVCDDAVPNPTLLLFEVKMPGCDLTPAETKWHSKWPGPVYIVHSIDEALAIARRRTM